MSLSNGEWAIIWNAAVAEREETKKADRRFAAWQKKQEGK